MSDLLQDAIREHVGERCPDFDPGCPGCQAWAEYDEITRLRAENERLRAALHPFAEAADGFDATRIKNPEEWFAYGGVISATETKGAITVGDLRRARAALTQPAPSPWRPTHRHQKRGSTYEVLGEAEVQAGMEIWEGERVTVYRGEDGRMWARPVEEFNDGRFEPLPPAPKTEET